jgi:hypothetical protein
MISNKSKQEKSYDRITEIIFEDTEIDETWDVEFSAREGITDYYGRKENYSPRQENPLDVRLNTKNKGKISPIPPHTSTTTGEGSGNINSKWHSVKKWFDKYQFKIFAGTIVAFIIFILVFLFKISNEGNSVENTSLTIKKQIIDYAKGDSLFLNQLEGYEAKWKEMEPEVKKEGGSWLSIFGIGSEEGTLDSADYKEWVEVMKSIKSAIIKRKLIDETNFVQLKALSYSEKQQAFKSAFEGIKNTNYEKFKNQLHRSGIEGLTLTQIADSINDILESGQMGRKQPTDTQEDPQPSQETEVPRVSGLNEVSENTQSSTSSQPNIADPNNQKIIEYLKSENLKKSELEDYRKSTKDPKLQKSIDLALDLWSLDPLDYSYSEYVEKLEKDKYLKGSELTKLINNNTKLNYVKKLSSTDQKESLSKFKNKIIL